MMSANGQSRRPILFQAFFVLVIFLLLWRGSSSISIIIENKSILLSLFGLFIVGPLWIAYGRLNGLDISDGLKPSQSKAVNDFAIWAKRILLAYFVGSIAFIVVAAVLLLIGNAFPDVKNIVLSFAISILMVFFVTTVLRIVEILYRVERTLSSVNAWRLEQKERNKQIEGLKRAREERLIPDERLLRYREVMAGEGEGSADPPEVSDVVGGIEGPPEPQES